MRCLVRAHSLEIFVDVLRLQVEHAHASWVIFKMLRDGGRDWPAANDLKGF